MNIKKVTGNKKEYLDFLLLADEQENVIDKYFEISRTVYENRHNIRYS